MRIDSDDFALFGLPRRFALDRADLDARRRSLQGEVHPDRFVAGGAAAQRLAMQWAVRVNEAYERLADPLRRARYLCELDGVPVDAEGTAEMPAGFLNEQMERREALDAVRNRDGLEAFAAGLDAERADAMRRLAQLLDDEHDYAGAAAQVRAMMFFARLADEVDDRLAVAVG